MHTGPKQVSKERKPRPPSLLTGRKVVSLDRTINYIDRLLYEEQQQVGFANVASQELADFAYRTLSKFVSDIKKLMKIDKNLKVKSTYLTYSSTWRIRAGQTNKSRPSASPLIAGAHQ